MLCAGGCLAPLEGPQLGTIERTKIPLIEGTKEAPGEKKGECIYSSTAFARKGRDWCGLNTRKVPFQQDMLRNGRVGSSLLSITLVWSSTFKVTFSTRRSTPRADRVPAGQAATGAIPYADVTRRACSSGPFVSTPRPLHGRCTHHVTLAMDSSGRRCSMAREKQADSHTPPPPGRVKEYSYR